MGRLITGFCIETALLIRFTQYFDLDGGPRMSLSFNWFNFDFWIHCFKHAFLNDPRTSQCRASVAFFVFELFLPLPRKGLIFPLRNGLLIYIQLYSSSRFKPSLCLVNPVCLIPPHTTLTHTHTHTYTQTHTHIPTHTPTHCHTYPHTGI